MAVIAPVELDQQRASRGRAGQSYGAHGGFGAGAHEPDHVHRREGGDDPLRETQLELGRGAEGGAGLGRLDDRLQHLGVGVAQDQGPPGEEQVHVAVAIGIHQPGPFPAGDEARRAADALERPHRAVHPAGEEAL
jgi:hypothetical protein